MKTQRLTPLMLISCGVLLVHVCGIIWLGIQKQEILTFKKKENRLLVQAVHLNQPVEKASVAAAPPKEPEPAPPQKKIEQPKPKKQPKPKPKEAPKPKPKKKKPPKKKEEKTPPPQPKKTEKTNRKKELLAQVKAKMGKVKPDASPTAAPSSKISPLGALRIDSLGVKNSPYQRSLVDYLKQTLRLPDYGDVQVKVTVQRSGTITNIEIVNAASTPNRDYLKKKLPNMQFPSFGKAFEGESSHTFLLTLTNA